MNLGIHIVADDPSQKMSMKVMSTDYNRIATVVFYKVLNNTDIFTLFIFGESWLHSLRDLVYGTCRMWPQLSRIQTIL